MEADNRVSFWLLETLLKAVSADVWGNAHTWFQTPIGQHLIVQTVDASEQVWRLPMLLKVAELWQYERQLALRRFRPSTTRSGRPS